MNRRFKAMMVTSLFWWRLELAAFLLTIVCIPLGIGMLSAAVALKDRERQKQVPEDACRKAARESMERVWTEAERKRLLIACATTGPTRARTKVLT